MRKGKEIVWLLLACVMGAGSLSWPWKARAEAPYPNLTPAQARELIGKQAGNPDFVILDVRTPGEYRSGRIGEAVLLDYNSGKFRSDLGALDRGKTYLVYCRTGNRSGRAIREMKEEGFRNVYHLDGGILKWEEAGLPTRK